MKTSIRDIVRRERWAKAYQRETARSYLPTDDGVTVRVNAWVAIMSDMERERIDYLKRLFETYLDVDKGDAPTG